MDLRALRYFIETVRHNSFTLAAEALHVTQSTVSKMVRQLEDEVGQPLLIRDGRQLRLTDVGRVVFERGQETLDGVRRLSREVADLTELAGHLGGVLEGTRRITRIINSLKKSVERPRLMHYALGHDVLRLEDDLPRED